MLVFRTSPRVNRLPYRERPTCDDQRTRSGNYGRNIRVRTYGLLLSRARERISFSSSPRWCCPEVKNGIGGLSRHGIYIYITVSRADLDEFDTQDIT